MKSKNIMNLKSDKNNEMEELRKILDYQPSGISEDDIENAYSEMEYFFVNFPLPEARANMWELYEGWVHFEAESPEGQAIKDMLFFYEQMIKFINFAFVATKLNR